MMSMEPYIIEVSLQVYPHFKVHRETRTNELMPLSHMAGDVQTT